MGYVEVLKGMNAVIMRDRVSKIAKVKSLMMRLDSKAEGFVLRTLKIEHASAKNISERLDKLYGDMRRKMLVGNDPVVVADEYSNMLLIASEDRDFEKIQYIISQLDSPNSASHNAPKVFYLNNANAEDVEKVLNKLTGIENNAKGKNSNVKSTVAYDKATNSIIAFGDQELYARVEQLIEKLDVPRQQVYVEALILETTLGNGNKFGVEWQAGGEDGDNVIGSVGFVNDDGGYLNNFQNNFFGSNPNPGALPGGFSLGVLGNIINYNGAIFPTLGAFVNFTKSANDINLLSNPQILTLDNEEAEVFVGENRPFLTSTKYDSNNNPVQSYDYRDVGVKLKILPQISANDTITLTIEQEVKKVTASSVSATAPTTLTRSTKTKVKLKDGSMMVISGLLKDDSDNNISAVPGLSKIPLIGWLFKNRSGSSDKTNMMVFISTYIIKTQEDAEKLTKKKRQQSVDFKAEIDEKIKKDFR
jgi:general secretion pathway protein D